MKNIKVGSWVCYKNHTGDNGIYKVTYVSDTILRFSGFKCSFNKANFRLAEPLEIMSGSRAEEQFCNLNHKQQAALIAKQNDEKAVDDFAERMKEKLALAREKGRSGWNDITQCNANTFLKLFVEHLKKDNKDNLLDLANLLMMLDFHGGNTADIFVLLESQS